VTDLVPNQADFEAIVDRLKWSWDHLERFKLTMVEEGVHYHWTRAPKTQTQAGQYIDLIVDEATPPPPHLKFVIGDCIHSLRASLDNLIYLLCPTDFAEFLVCKTSDQWERQKWKIKDLPDKAKDWLHKLQPFQLEGSLHPEANPLWILDRLWNDDKHRAPHIAVGITDEATIDGAGEDIWAIFNTGPLELGSVVARIWVFTDPEPDFVPNFSFDVAFDVLGPARGFTVYPYLAQLHHVVGDIVEGFRLLFVPGEMIPWGVFAETPVSPQLPHGAPPVA
jgi:hypothetical protein